MRMLTGIVSIAALAMACGMAYAEKPVKIYILSGQSNMNTFRHTLDELKKGYPNLEIPTRNIWYVEAGFRGGLPKENGGWGVETPFGIDMAKDIKSPVLLFKSNQGGTTLTKDWRPPSTVKRSGGEVGYLYNRMIRRLHNMIKDVETICPPVKERGYEIAGFVWFQGESDACDSDPEVWKDYKEKLRELIADVRSDVGVPNLPFLIVQINNIPLWDGTPDKPKGGAIIREAEKKVAEEDPKGVWISTSNLSNGYHYDANAHMIIGQRMAQAMLPLAKEVVPTDPTKVRAAGKAFLQRVYPDAKPDVSSLKNGLIFHLTFDDGDKPSIADRISAKDGKVVGEVKYCDGLFGKGIAIDCGDNRNNPNRIEYPEFKDPVQDGFVKSLTVSFWLRTTDGHVGDAVSKYARVKEYNSMKDGWRTTVSAYGQTGMDVKQDGVAEWNPNPPKPKKGEEPKKGRPYVHAYGAGKSTPYGDGVEWHHVVTVYDGAAKTMRAYVDADCAVNPKKSPWAENIPGNGIVPSAAPLTISNTPANSAMDEVAIWNRALTEDEIKALYNNGNGVELK
jgi:hypothetical protein